MDARRCADHGRHPACLQHRVTIAGSHRFLFVFVLDDLPQLRVAELVAHELQHAIEVADAGITRADDFEPLYERIGEPCEYQHDQQCRETVAAIAVQNRVMRELADAGRRTSGDSGQREVLAHAATDDRSSSAVDATRFIAASGMSPAKTSGRYATGNSEGNALRGHVSGMNQTKGNDSRNLEQMRGTPVIEPPSTRFWRPISG